jgi:hypothetical protein
MTDGRKGRGHHSGISLPANDALPEPARKLPYANSLVTSPAFDRWLERQMKLLMAAAESPPDPKLLEVIQQAFLPDEDEVTD